MAASNSELAALQAQFAAVKTEASELVTGLAESQFNWRPDPRKWSIAECLSHLNMIGDRYVHAIDKIIEEQKGKGRPGAASSGHGWFGKWILRHTEPPSKHTYRAPRSLTPAYGQPVTAVMPTFLHLQDQLMRQIEQAASLDLPRIKVPALEMRPLKFNLYLTFAWIAAHERRHLWQAGQVRAHNTFPHSRAVAV